MDAILSLLSPIIPAGLDLQAAVQFLLILIIGSAVLGVIGRLFGKRSGLNHSVSSAIGILFVYAVVVVIYTFNPAQLSRYLAPLPFVSFQGETMHIFSIIGADYPAICTQVLNLLILAFLVNLLDSILPRGQGVTGWYLWRFITIALAVVLQILVSGFFEAFLPDVLVTYAPIILVAILIIMFLLGAVNAILSLLLVAVNPLIAAIYTFLFSTLVGKMLTRAVMTTVILSALVYALNYLGFAALAISASALAAYVPFVVIVLLLWYLLGFIL